MNSEQILLLVFGFLVSLIFGIDLFLLKGKEIKPTTKFSLIWLGFCWLATLVFSYFIFQIKGATKASEFLTAYLIEEALSIDNLFVFIIIFSYFQIPQQYQKKALAYGIIGAIFFRAIFILSGIWLVEKTYLPSFELLGYKVSINLLLTFFGAFMLYVGLKLLIDKKDKQSEISENLAIKLAKKLFKMSQNHNKGKFFIYENGKKLATPLLLAVIAIEFTDIIFAVDSIPAIFAVSSDPFILYSSNIFAILGLRALYFLLADFMAYFFYLRYGLALILCFIGLKMIVACVWHFPPSISLAFILGTLLLSVLVSIIKKPSNL